jgi:hypothetical protein
MLVVISIAGSKRFWLFDTEHTCKCKYKVIPVHTHEVIWTVKKVQLNSFLTSATVLVSVFTL